MPNPGFEERSYCPTNFNQQELRSLKVWKQIAKGTPDHYDRCSSQMGVPENFSGSQEAFEGDAYAGLILFTESKNNYREYLQAKLEHPLTAGQLYCVELHLSHSDKASYVCDGFGVHFSKERLTGNRSGLIPAEEHFGNPSLHLLDNTEDWVKISDVFEAKGGEEYITIGNFRADKEMKILLRTESKEAVSSNDWSYLYLDEVKVEPVDERSECSCINDLIRAEIHDPPLQLNESFSVRFENVLFDFDQSILTSEAQEDLLKVALQMRSKPSWYLEVIGHTDIIGRADYNIDLSRERAESVIDYLQNKGIAEDRLLIKYYGSDKPIADNTSEEGRLQNRRVEFEIRQKKYLLHRE